MKIGILGGTFDPVHRGHTFVARRILEAFGLDRVLFMVSKKPPHKQSHQISSAYHRYAMVALEVLTEEGLFASQWELEHSDPCYTIDTLRYFSTHFPNHVYCFVAGTDSLREIQTWAAYSTLLTNYTFIFVQRPGARIKLEELQITQALKHRIRLFRKGEKPAILPGRSHLARLNAPAVSSTTIRKIFSDGRCPPTNILSPAVLNYVKKYELYDGNKSGS